MNAMRLWAVSRKESIHVLRDPRALGISIALPLVLLLLFGFALTLDVDHVPLVIWDQSNTPQSRELLSRFTASPYFSLKSYVTGYRAIEENLDRSKAFLALVVPADFDKRLQDGRSAPLQLIADGSDSNTASIAMGYADAIVRKYSQELRVTRMARASGRTFGASLDVRPRVWFNTDMESRNFIVPGLIAVIIMLISAILTSLTVSKEWEVGTMEQLISTPVRGRELILGKLAPYFVIGMIDTVLSVLAGRYLFDVPLRGSIFLLFLVTAFYLIGSLSLGILISIAAKSQLLANQVAFVTTFLPAFLLSGFMFDIGNMPRALQIITYLIPARYYVAFLRGLFLKGVGIQELWVQGAFLVAFSAIMLGLALKIFRKRLA